MSVESGGVYGIGDPGYEWGWFVAVGGCRGGCGAVRVDVWGTRVAEYGRSAIRIGVETGAAARSYGAEPVVVDGLVGFDDYIITLADAEEEPISCYGIDGD